MKQRIQWIDLAKGFCILIVVFGHSQIPMKIFGSDAINTLMSVFRMPLFFLISGIFFKTYNGLGEFLQKKINNLLIPYTVFFCLDLCVPYYQGGPIWFLFSLFLANLWGYALLYATRGRPLTLITVSLILAIIGYHMHLEHYTDYKLLTQHIAYTEASLVGQLFFVIGYLLRSATSFLTAAPRLCDAMLAVLLLGVTIGVDYYYGWADTSYVINDYQLPLLWTLILGLIGTMAVLLLSRLLVRIPLVSFLGRYSIIVLITHSTILFCLYTATERLLPDYANEWYTPLVVFIVTIILEIPTILFCRRYLPYLFAQKNVFSRLVV